MICGIILAAGVSSRMGSFKPMLKIGDTTFIRRLIGQMKKAGAEEIIVVTGYRHTELEKHILADNVTCVFNDQFYCTQMLDSVKLALMHVPDECDAVILSPVDAVLTPYRVLSTMLDKNADFVRPVYEGKSGHPIMIRKGLFDRILAYDGDGGLRGALEHADCKIYDIQVQDPNILMDADTRKDYQKALNEYDLICGNAGKLHIDTDIILLENNSIIPEEFIQLLELIDCTGSLSKASNAMHMSYTKAWKMVREIEQKTKNEILVREAGGESGGGSYLTESGKEFLHRYKRMRKELNTATEKIFIKYFGEFTL